MDGYDYDALAGTIKVDDITSNSTNQIILRKLKENDPDFTVLWVRDMRNTSQGNRSASVHDGNDYLPESNRDVGWLGYFISKNTILKELHLQANPFHNINNQWDNNNAIELFCRGVNNNRSIQKISFVEMDLSGGETFPFLSSFFTINNNLSKIVVSGCNFGVGSARQLSLALRGCSKSLKHLEFSGNEMGGEQSTGIIEALSAHPQLENLELWHWQHFYVGQLSNCRTSIYTAVTLMMKG